jgi:hypothetical protein
MSGRGSAHLAKHRTGGRLTQRQAILAKCADCTCDFADGREDCDVESCPLHPFMPYRRGQSAGVGSSVSETRSTRVPRSKVPPSSEGAPN